MATLQDDPNNWVDRLGFTDYSQIDVIFSIYLFVFLFFFFFSSLKA